MVPWRRVTFFNNDAGWLGTQRRVLSDFARNQRRRGCGNLCGEPQDSTSRRKIDTANGRNASPTARRDKKHGPESLALTVLRTRRSDFWATSRLLDSRGLAPGCPSLVFPLTVR